MAGAAASQVRSCALPCGGVAAIWPLQTDAPAQTQASMRRLGSRNACGDKPARTRHAAVAVADRAWTWSPGHQHPRSAPTQRRPPSGAHPWRPPIAPTDVAGPVRSGLPPARTSWSLITGRAMGGALGSPREGPAGAAAGARCRSTAAVADIDGDGCAVIEIMALEKPAPPCPSPSRRSSVRCDVPTC
jgi:hypothetical protein